MGKKYSTNPSVAEEPLAEYNSTPEVAIPASITVDIEDVKMLKEIKQAIKMIRGVVSVRKKPKVTGIERAYSDVKAGRVKTWENLEALKEYADKL